MEAKKFNTWRKEAQLFVGIWVQHGVSQLNLTQVVAGFHLQKSYFMKKIIFHHFHFSGTCEKKIGSKAIEQTAKG